MKNKHVKCPRKDIVPFLFTGKANQNSSQPFMSFVVIIYYWEYIRIETVIFIKVWDYIYLIICKAWLLCLQSRRHLRRSHLQSKNLQYLNFNTRFYLKVSLNSSPRLIRTSLSGDPWTCSWCSWFRNQWTVCSSARLFIQIWELVGGGGIAK